MARQITGEELVLFNQDNIAEGDWLRSEKDPDHILYVRVDSDWREGCTVLDEAQQPVGTGPGVDINCWSSLEGLKENSSDYIFSSKLQGVAYAPPADRQIIRYTTEDIEDIEFDDEDDLPPQEDEAPPAPLPPPPAPPAAPEEEEEDIDMPVLDDEDAPQEAEYENPEFSSESEEEGICCAPTSTSGYLPELTVNLNSMKGKVASILNDHGTLSAREVVWHMRQRGEWANIYDKQAFRKCRSAIRALAAAGVPVRWEETKQLCMVVGIPAKAVPEAGALEAEAPVHELPAEVPQDELSAPRQGIAIPTSSAPAQELRALLDEDRLEALIGRLETLLGRLEQVAEVDLHTELFSTLDPRSRRICLAQTILLREMPELLNSEQSKEA